MDKNQLMTKLNTLYIEKQNNSNFSGMNNLLELETEYLDLIRKELDGRFQNVDDMYSKALGEDIETTRKVVADTHKGMIELNEKLDSSISKTIIEL